MKKLHYLLFAMIMGLAVSFTSCSSDDDSPVGPVTPEVSLPEATISMADVMAIATGDVAEQITNDAIFRGVVVYNPATQNQTHTLYIQSKDAELALKLSVNEDATFSALKPGQEVAVKIKGLWIAKKYDVVLIGSAADEKYTVAAITDEQLQDILVSGDVIEFAPKVKTIDELSKDILGTLVTIENVQFDDNSKTKAYYEGTSSYVTRTLTTIDGKTIDVSTYKNATFGTEVTPEGSGSVTGLLGLFQDKWQLILRNTDEVALTGERFTVEGSDNGDNTGGDNGEDDGDNGVSLFPGSDFETWETFTGALNQYGLKDYATQSDAGQNDTKAMQISGTPTGNDYVFTALVPEGFDAAGKTKIIFYVKGTSGKSLSLNVYTADGYSRFNLGEYSAAGTIEPSTANSYTGAIDTAGEWLKVTLNIADVALQSTKGESLFALKVGKNEAYDLLIDNITIK